MGCARCGGARVGWVGERAEFSRDGVGLALKLGKIGGWSDE